MNQLKIERLCIWSGLLSVFMFFGSFGLSHFIPPLSPSLTPTQVQAHYQEHQIGVTAGMVMMVVSCMFFAPFIGIIAAQLRRMQGVSSALAYTQITAGTANLMFFIIPGAFFVITAYRPDRDMNLTFTLNDAAWILTVLTWPPAFMQNMSIALATLGDKSPQPVFPRWVAFLNIWVAISLVTGGLLPFFKSGPFAWNGLLVFWLAGPAYTIWAIAMVVMMLKVNTRQQAGA